MDLTDASGAGMSEPAVVPDEVQAVGPPGLRVSELFLRTMTFGEDWGWGAPPEECRRILDTYAEAGGNVIDTAVNYTDGAR
jgi:aryl-alcohol dehydrogenase-like predicted oxidoreductase